MISVLYLRLSFSQESRWGRCCPFPRFASCHTVFFGNSRPFRPSLIGLSIWRPSCGSRINENTGATPTE
ncbi:hypothetical protein CIPAW_15G116900 [Carya illinoinensis]|uniref:Uncharacterized protein n=1 Tax=Carya illinoinensis TaxID=32201 RepID=A0A8T1NBU4_CARIL|nr:hypothetical protein CIPAW_15G116900 [Carya illinoinensis]